MARGKAYPAELKEKAYALLATGQTAEQVAKDLGLPYTTVSTWGKKASTDEEFVRLRNEKKAEFVNQAWGIVEKSTKLLGKKIDRALNREEELDALLDKIFDETDFENKRQKMNALEAAKRISMMKLDNLDSVARTLGIMYDKQALAGGDSTVNVSGVEQLLTKVTAKNDY